MEHPAFWAAPRVLAFFHELVSDVLAKGQRLRREFSDAMAAALRMYGATSWSSRLYEHATPGGKEWGQALQRSSSWVAALEFVCGVASSAKRRSGRFASDGELVQYFEECWPALLAHAWLWRNHGPAACAAYIWHVGARGGRVASACPRAAASPLQDDLADEEAFFM